MGAAGRRASSARCWRPGPNGRVTFLIRGEPGARFPGPPHADDEECYVLEGDITFETLTLRAGDYHRGAARSLRIPGASTTRGCLLLITAAAARKERVRRRLALPSPPAVDSNPRGSLCSRGTMPTHNLLLLPGDGIGPEVMAEVKRAHRLDERARDGPLRYRGGAGRRLLLRRPRGRDHRRHDGAGARRRCGDLRRGGRAEMGQGAVRCAPRGGPAAPAQGPRASTPTCARP